VWKSKIIDPENPENHLGKKTQLKKTFSKETPKTDEIPFRKEFLDIF